MLISPMDRVVRLRSRHGGKARRSSTPISRAALRSSQMAPRRAALQARALPEGAVERLIGLACLSPSVGLSEPWRFVIVEDAARRAAIRDCFETCNKDALAMQTPDRAALYARLKLAGLDEAPCRSPCSPTAPPRKAQGSAGDHARGARLFGGDRRPHLLARRPRRRDRASAGCRSSIRRAWRRSSICRRDWVFIGHLCVGYPLKEDDSRCSSARAGSIATPPTAWCCTASAAHFSFVMPAEVPGIHRIVTVHAAIRRGSAGTGPAMTTVLGKGVSALDCRPGKGHSPGGD